MIQLIMVALMQTAGKINAVLAGDPSLLVETGVWG
jgi:hypothetical protein